MSHPRPATRRPATRGFGLLGAAALTASLLAGCGSEEDPTPSADTGGDDAASGTPEEAAATPGDAGLRLGVVVLDGVTYQFGADGGQCAEVSGGLLVNLPLVSIDGEDAAAGEGALDLTIYPDALAEESAITVQLPSGRYAAGYNDINLDTPPVTLERDGLIASGPQQLVSVSGEPADANIRVQCS